MIACTRCKALNLPGAKYCGQCGYPRRGAITQPLDTAAMRKVLDSYLAIPLEHSPQQVRALLQPVVDFRRVLWREEIQVTFFGSFKSGKSTLINAVVGADLLPTRVLRATGGITRIRYAPQPCAGMLRISPSGTSYIEPVNFDERAQHILLDLAGSGRASPAVLNHRSTAGQNSRENGHEMSLGIPLEMLKGCVLVDTPGLMDDSTLTAQSYRELSHSDLVVMVLSAYQLLSHREKEAARNVHRLLNGNIVFVVNQMDLIAAGEREDVLERARMVLQGVGNTLVGQPRIFGTEALPAFAARMHGLYEGDAVDAIHDVRAFEQWLTRLVHSPAGQQIAFVSRLGILARHLERISEFAHRQLGQAAQAERQARQAAATAQATRQARLSSARAEDGLRLGRLESRLDALGEAFVGACLRRIEYAMQTSQHWHRNLKACLYYELQVYSQRIERGASAALTRTALAVPPFDVYKTPAQPEIAAVEEWLAGIGFWSGLIPGIGTPLPELPALPLLEEAVGAVVGDLVSQTRTEAKQQIVKSLEQAIRSLLPHLRTAAQHYLEQVRAMLLAVEELPAAEGDALAVLAQAEKTERYYRYLVGWCEEFQQTIARVGEMVARRDST